MTSISDFCDQHGACEGGRQWAIANCTDMADAWKKLQHEWLLYVATRPGVLTDRELRLFAVFCARQVEHLLTDQRSIDAIDTAERFAKDEVTCEELTAAWAAARAAVWDAARAASAAWDAATAWGADLGAARAASADASRAAASATDASRAAASATARDAAWAAATAADADWGAARAAQAEWLRANTQPNFGMEVTQ